MSTCQSCDSVDNEDNVTRRAGSDGGPGQGQGGGGGYYDGTSAYIPTIVTDTFGDSTSRGMNVT